MIIYIKTLVLTVTANGVGRMDEDLVMMMMENDFKMMIISFFDDEKMIIWFVN